MRFFLNIFPKSFASIFLYLNNFPRSFFREMRVIEKKKRFSGRFKNCIECFRRKNVDVKVALLDATYDNPNYWYHLSLMSSALNIDMASSISLLGKYANKQISYTLDDLGVGKKVYYKNVKRVLQEDVERIAQELINSASGPDDVINWKLPEQFPARVFYDTLLKKQRNGFVDVDHPNFQQDVEDSLSAIFVTREILKSNSVQVLLASHNIGEIAAPLCWNAMRMGIPVYVLYGDFGGPRYIKVTNEPEFCRCVSAPTVEEFALLTASQKNALNRNGKEYLNQRFAGVAGDIGSTLAFGGKETGPEFDQLLKEFGWEKEKPIVSVYVPNWFDFPNSLGLERFRDFYDWMEEVFTVAKTADHVNWLIRAHPLDKRYGVRGEMSVRAMTDRLACGHVRNCPENIGSGTVIKHSAGVLTALGSVGLEANYFDTPAIVSERAWYGGFGFVVEPGSREKYLEALRTNWWEQVDTAEAKEKMETFAGFYYGYPSWQKGLILRDNTVQEELYDDLNILFEKARVQIGKEVSEIEEWIQSDYKQYHVFKNLKATDYIHGAMSNSVLSQ